MRRVSGVLVAGIVAAAVFALLGARDAAAQAGARAAATERKLGRDEAALAAWVELTESRNGYRVKALEELAKHYEHRERNYGMALEMTRAALEVAESATLRRREERLRGRVDRQSRRLL